MYYTCIFEMATSIFPETGRVKIQKMKIPQMCENQKIQHEEQAVQSFRVQVKLTKHLR